MDEVEDEERRQNDEKIKVVKRRIGQSKRFNEINKRQHERPSLLRNGLETPI